LIHRSIQDVTATDSASKAASTGTLSPFSSEHITFQTPKIDSHMAVCQNLVPLVNIKIAGKWMFIPLKMVLIGIDPYPHDVKHDLQNH
jgi:hypothetical protein